MKLIHRNITKDSSGQITLIAEDGEDMWHAYNIIQPGDSLRSSTVRKVLVESNTGSSTSSRVRTTLTITVETLDFDSKGCVLRVKGRNIVENQFVKGVEKFFDSVLQAILRHVNFDVVKCVLLASPGFVKDQFHEYMFNYATKTDNRLLIENKSKFLLVHSSSGFKHSLKEVLSDPAVIARLSDTKAAEEIRALEGFYKMLHLEPDRAYYGEKEVFKAAESQAVDTLLICDALLRTHDVAKRKRLVAVVDSVRENGGSVRVFSSMHITGEQLYQLTGIAAILRFPVPGLTDDESSDDEGL